MRFFVKALATIAGLATTVVAPAPQVGFLSSRAYAAEKSVEERIKVILVEHLGVDPERVMPKARLIQDLGMDSLDAVEVAMAVETEFNIKITDGECKRLASVDDVCQHVRGKLSK